MFSIEKILNKEMEGCSCGAVQNAAANSKSRIRTITAGRRQRQFYNNFAHLEKRGWKYLIRLRDRHRTYAYGVTLPDLPEFDIPIKLTLGRLTPKQLKQRGVPLPEAYYRLPSNVPFDCLEPDSTEFYVFSARLMRISLKDGASETLMTNLDRNQFPPAVLRSLYARRWGIETSFRQLKYTVGMVHLHSKRPELILQEILATFIIFNFSQAAAWDVDTGRGRSKYEIRVNFSDAVYLCCQALRGSSVNVAYFLARSLLPLRPGRHYHRPVY